MVIDSFPPSAPSFSPYVYPPISYSSSLFPQPSHLDYDDDGELSPVPSADEHTQDPGPGSSKSAKSGRKKTNPNSQAARRDQNRIAQREFRLRKQQRIRDLEARVEILSEGQDEAYAQLRDIIRDLMDENTTLRGLLRDVAGFVGEGLGGTLKPRTGWDPVKFREFCERGETDTAYEGWIARKRARGGPSTSAPPGSEHADEEDQGDSAASRKRRRSTRKDAGADLARPPVGPNELGSSEGRMSSGDSSLPRPHLDGLDIDWSSTGLSIPQSNPNARSKRDLVERPQSATSSATTFQDSYPSNFPGGNSGGGGSYPSNLDLGQSSQRHSPAGNPNAMPSFSNTISPQLSSTRTRVRPSVDSHADILPPLSSISTLGPPPLDVGGGLSIGVGVNIGSGGQTPANSLFQQSFGVPQLGSYGPGSVRPMSAGGPSQPGMYYSLHPGGEGQAGMSAGEEYSDADPQLREAGALIKYHIDNYRRNENYHLPLSLRPTLTQRTVQHSGVIDGLIFPSMRDRAILLSGRFDLGECFADLMRGVVIHGDDVLAHANWELSLSWLKRYHFLVDESILTESVNVWRRKRGEREITLQDIQPAPSD
ncbi:hypothetical protein BDV93DRAFT_550819 [Ceratobasidium sp. AG-I]|nr:hypothetical protein BDV93DRAFT_550819 [Ceratobasidium sp. AG-I]